MCDSSLSRQAVSARERLRSRRPWFPANTWTNQAAPMMVRNMKRETMAQWRIPSCAFNVLGAVGGTCRRWLVHDLASQYCRSGGPASANHLIRHDAHDNVSRRRELLMERSKVPEHRKKRRASCKILPRGYLGKQSWSSGRRPMCLALSKKKTGVEILRRRNKEGILRHGNLRHDVVDFMPSKPSESAKSNFFQNECFLQRTQRSSSYGPE